MGGAVDLAARVRYLAAGDRDKARELLITYQDRTCKDCGCHRTF